GDDHLLFVENSGFTETYKRFYFRDIQAITIRRTTARRLWNWFLGGGCVVCLIFCDFKMLSAGHPGAGTIVLLVFAALLGIPLLINNLLGSTCAGQLRTAVQVEELPSLCRLRQTRKVLDKIRPLIVATQGQLTAEEVSARMQETVADATAQPSAPTPTDGTAPPILS
ncbi:MAG: hypothetical protein WBQ21_06680, partial [Solirubrobacteraceae bacterium]